MFESKSLIRIADLETDIAFAGLAGTKVTNLRALLNRAVDQVARGNERIASAILDAAERELGRL